MAELGSSQAGDSSFGSSVTLEQLAGAEAPKILAELNAVAPATWLSAIDGWLVTDRALALEVMRDADRFTVDDPRFTTGQVVGPSMLSLDGAEHRRHRSPFIAPFRPRAVAANYTAMIEQRARALVIGLQPQGRAELRTELAGPLAVSVITHALGLDEVDDSQVLAWYRSIVDGVTALSSGQQISQSSQSAVQSLRDRVAASVSKANSDPDGVSGLLQLVSSSADLTIDQLFSNVAVVMFGAIETCEGMTSNALYHLLSLNPERAVPGPDLLAELRANPDLVDRAIEESLRLEPAAAVVDRYATTNAMLGREADFRSAENNGEPAEIAAGDLVRISLLAANRDPHHFPNPDRFDPLRPNAADHLAFVQGPHACIGAHLARAETRAAVVAVLDLLPDVALSQTATTAPTGLIFRKPEQLFATWTAG